MSLYLIFVIFKVLNSQSAFSCSIEAYLVVCAGWDEEGLSNTTQQAEVDLVVRD